jgi:phage/plasmid primase-like uncharacterized protein
MAKATEVRSAAQDPYSLPMQECVVCGKKLRAPFGRVSNGGWVCSKWCDMKYDETHAVTIPQGQPVG